MFCNSDRLIRAPCNHARLTARPHFTEKRTHDYPSTNYEYQPQDNQQLPKYDVQKLAINLGVLTVLGGVVAFAVIFLVSATINAFSNHQCPNYLNHCFS
ncbi:hypothetical protein [Corynebacterium belfantii]|uniref:Uncharacterized protein n=1 Tax=Corynebacterium belfantii TaxID=2014537 RepID=A0ABS0LH26_9CORY|nr:hypothetical protein [Corynebacterium belfantii]OWM36496.1 hypothetical protein AZF07_09860 [Corynebacterium diphtheriae subsp. lausannense]STC66233.1 Uncharacterised protein [Corynebacterium diphtheriae]MBG9334584.1 hypothetical protein [Corynebacterium belfantii]MBG9348115.1 hypothetical protein [Corynebacterium belfantii]MBG9350688.1 hypothetical protein [Corynebacterium belfantii]